MEIKRARGRTDTTSSLFSCWFRKVISAGLPINKEINTLRPTYLCMCLSSCSRDCVMFYITYDTPETLFICTPKLLGSEPLVFLQFRRTWKQLTTVTSVPTRQIQTEKKCSAANDMTHACLEPYVSILSVIIRVTICSSYLMYQINNSIKLQ